MKVGLKGCCVRIWLGCRSSRMELLWLIFMVWYRVLKWFSCKVVSSSLVKWLFG